MLLNIIYPQNTTSFARSLVNGKPILTVFCSKNITILFLLAHLSPKTCEFLFLFFILRNLANPLSTCANSIPKGMGCLSPVCCTLGIMYCINVLVHTTRVHVLYQCVVSAMSMAIALSILCTRVHVVQVRKLRRMHSSPMRARCSARGGIRRRARRNPRDRSRAPSTVRLRACLCPRCR